ncbi:MAG TPA: hypothetical protein VGM90_27835 [Kofleriaceae bacterium]
MTPIESLITRLVQEAPAIDDGVVAELVHALRSDGRALARSIAEVVSLVGEQLVDAGIALPALAMACTTLGDARLGEKEREAARFEIETLLPLPDKGSNLRLVVPDVPVDALKKKRRLN